MTFPNSSFDETPAAPVRRPYRPPIGIPDRIEERTWRGWLASVLLHASLIALILVPALIGSLALSSDSAGARTPRGGGGGGLMGDAERLRYVRIQPVAPTSTKTPTALPPPPAVVEPPKPVPPAAASPPPAEPAPAVSAGGPGSGTDASAGNGPGTGGGTGSGTGAGAGSGAGPGTGGDGNTKYPPVVTNLAILPIPVPSGVRPYKMIAYFDVDERGHAQLITFNPSRDGGYNRRIKEMLGEIRFKPATMKNGTAVRDTAMIIAEAP